MSVIAKGPSIFDLELDSNHKIVSGGRVSRALQTFEGRQKKIRNRSIGAHHSWLLVNVDSLPNTDQDERIHWLSDRIVELEKLLPSSAYKVIFGHLASRKELGSLIDKFGILKFSVREGLQVVILPTVGLVCFRSPPGNLKDALDYAGFECEWNWAVGAALFDETESELGSTMSQDELVNWQSELASIQEKVGKGKDTVIAIIDSGICSKSSELHGRVVAQFEIAPTGDGDPGFIVVEAKEFEPKLAHGTRVAAIAAGETIGVAPCAKVISIVLPVRDSSRYDQFALYFALELLTSDTGPTVGRRRLRDLIDTLLIANGIRLDRKIPKRLGESHVGAILEQLHNQYDICVVAAIGNQPGKVAFPASFQLVYSVGALDKGGERHKTSGFGRDSTGLTLPNINVLGHKLPTEGPNNHWSLVSGTSFAAASVAGIFAALAESSKGSTSRWTKMNYAVTAVDDECGELKKLDFDRLG